MYNTNYNPPGYDLYAMEADGTNRRMFQQQAHHPAFRGDGQKLLLVIDRPGNAEFIVRMNPDGSDFYPVTSNSADIQPSWAPNGESFIFADSSFEGMWLISHVTDFFSKQALGLQYATDKVPVNQLRGRSPLWTSTGTLALTSCDWGIGSGGSCGLFITNPWGGIPRQLTTEPNDTPSSAYDGRIAFMSVRNGNWDIYGIGEDGGGIRQLTNDPANEGLPTYSPDGKYIAYVSDQGGVWGIWTMLPDGSNQQRIADLGGIMGPDWPSERMAWMKQDE